MILKRIERKHDHVVVFLRAKIRNHAQTTYSTYISICWNVQTIISYPGSLILTSSMCRANRSIENIATVLARTPNIIKPEQSGLVSRPGVSNVDVVLKFSKSLKFVHKTVKSYFYGMLCAVCGCSRFRGAQILLKENKKQDLNFQQYAHRKLVHRWCTWLRVRANRLRRVRAANSRDSAIDSIFSITDELIHNRIKQKNAIYANFFTKFGRRTRKNGMYLSTATSSFVEFGCVVHEMCLLLKMRERKRTTVSAERMVEMWKSTLADDPLSAALHFPACESESFTFSRTQLCYHFEAFAVRRNSLHLYTRSLARTIEKARCILRKARALDSLMEDI